MRQNVYGKIVDVKTQDDSPKIFLDADNSVFLIEGPSYPEDPFDFYECVIHWIKQYHHQLKKPLNCEFKFKILNSSSRKLILEILINLEKALKKGVNVRVLWYYEELDEDMKDAGEDLADNVEIPFDVICIS